MSESKEAEILDEIPLSTIDSKAEDPQKSQSSRSSASPAQDDSEDEVDQLEDDLVVPSKTHGKKTTSTPFFFFFFFDQTNVL